MTVGTDKPSMFLTPAELAELTGIKIGRNNKTREQMQAAELTRLRIPHYVNAAGRVIVVRALIEGRPADAPPNQRWQSRPWEPSPQPAEPPAPQRTPPPSAASEKEG